MDPVQRPVYRRAAATGGRQFGQVPLARLLLATATGSQPALAVDFRGGHALMFSAMHGHIEFAELPLTLQPQRASGPGM